MLRNSSLVVIILAWLLVAGVESTRAEPPAVTQTDGAEARSRGGDSPVADAAERRDWDAVRALVSGDADPDAPQVDGMTALHWTAHHDEVKTTKWLLAAGAKADMANRYGVTPLSLACVNGNGEIVDWLLSAGANPNQTLPGGETPLMTAARTGCIEAMRPLIAHKAKVDARERKGQTALMWAAAEGNVEAVDVLLQAGADWKIELPSGFNALFFAVREGRTAVVERLLAAGADVNQQLAPKKTPAKGPRAGTTPLHLAVENGHFDLACKLLDAGADQNNQGPGHAVLHALTWVRKPIRGDGDPSPIGSGRMGTLEFTRVLLAHGADVNIPLKKGESGLSRFTTTGATAFVLAARTGDLALLKLLLELGADPTLANADHTTALLAAAGVGALDNGDDSAGTEQEALEVAKVLLELGLDVNAVDDNGETAMHGAAYLSWPAMVQFLVDHGADVKVYHHENRSGWTPLLIAQGHRPGNFRPDSDTIAAMERVMRAAGVEPPPDTLTGPLPGVGAQEKARYPAEKPGK